MSLIRKPHKEKFSKQLPNRSLTVVCRDTTELFLHMAKLGLVKPSRFKAPLLRRLTEKSNLFAHQTLVAIC